jgi:hypothetical protein
MERIRGTPFNAKRSSMGVQVRNLVKTNPLSFSQHQEKFGIKRSLM